MIVRNTTRRRGAIMFWLLVVLVAASAFSMTITADFATTRKALDRHLALVQAEEYLVFGMAIGENKLKKDAKYTGETLKVNAQVEITIAADGDKLKVIVSIANPPRSPIKVERVHQLKR
jgi:hypothetical protein